MIDKELLKYIPLYFGTRFLFIDKEEITILGYIENFCSHGFLHGEGKIWKPRSSIPDTNTYYEIDDISIGKFKLILTPLSDITDAEKSEYYALTKKINHISTNSFFRVDTPDSIKWMLLNSIDAFDLIGKNLAITHQRLKQYLDTVRKKTPL